VGSKTLLQQTELFSSSQRMMANAGCPGCPGCVCACVCVCVIIWCVGRVVCISHSDDLCTCSPSRHCLRYRYTLNDLLSLLSQLKDNISAFSGWSARVKAACTVPDTGQKAGTLYTHVRSSLVSVLNILHHTQIEREVVVVSTSLFPGDIQKPPSKVHDDHPSGDSMATDALF